jgi:hypothetical protein
VAKAKKNRKPKGNRKNIVKNFKRIKENDEVLKRLRNHETPENV